MIADLAVPIAVDGGRALALMAACRRRKRRWGASGVVAFGLAFLCLTAGLVTLTGDSPGGALVMLAISLGPTIAGVLLVRAAGPHRRKEQALGFVALFAEIRGAVSPVELAPLVAQPVDEAAALLAEVATVQRLGWAPPAPFATWDPARYTAFRRSRLQRTWWLGLASSPFLFVAISIWVLSVVALAQLEIMIAGVLLVAGFGPGLPGLAIASRAVAAYRDRDRVGRLIITLLAPSVTTMEEICRRVGADAGAARVLARAALQDGVLPPAAGARLGLVQVQAPVAPLVVQPMGSSPPPPSSAWPGRLLKGMWFVEAPLGAGGMGTVYAGRDVRSGSPIAVKIISPDVRLDEDAFRRFHREAHALATLKHPSIVALRDYDRTDDGQLFFVMDRLEGETLDAILQRSGSLPLQDALSIALQIGSALAAAHQAGLLHRDVKPSNIFVSGPTGAPRATLIDFGLAKSVGSHAASRVTTRGQAVGTPLYMSPEQARGDAVDARADIYALAVVTHEMVTGCPPFFDPSIAVVYAKLLSGHVPSIKSSGVRRAGAVALVEDHLDAVLQRALAPLAEDRPAHMGELVRELQAVYTAGSARQVAHG